MPALPAGTYPSSYGDTQPTMTAFVSAVVENLSNDTSSNLVQTGQVTGLLLKGASQIPLVGSQNGVFPFSNNNDTATSLIQTGQVTGLLLKGASQIPLVGSQNGVFPFSNNNDTAINLAQTGQVTGQLIIAISKIPLNASVSGGFVTVPIAPLSAGVSTELIIS